MSEQFQLAKIFWEAGSNSTESGYLDEPYENAG
jgi:hypothetical protein